MAIKVYICLKLWNNNNCDILNLFYSVLQSSYSPKITQQINFSGTWNWNDVDRLQWELIKKARDENKKETNSKNK